MRKFTFMSLLASLFIFSAFAQETTPVNFEIVENPLTEGQLPMTASGQQIWGDYDNDGDLDMFMVSGQGTAFSALYENNGDGTFTEVLTEATMLALSSAAFLDYNNDGNLDLIIAGSVDGTAEAALTELYLNSGAPDYELQLQENQFFVGISSESGDNNTHLIEVVDYDNDGWTDVFLSGNAGGDWEVSGNARVVALYKNNQGSFVLQETPVDGISNFASMNGGGIHAGDVNNDGYTDMIVSGYVDSEIQTVTDLYINQGDGTFSFYADSRTVFTGHTQGETFFADVNNDGWLDIVEVGRDVNNGWANFANLFINNQDLSFTKIESATSGLIGGSASAATGDLNNDGLIDIGLSGWGPNMTFFYNQGDSTFLPDPIEPDIARARAGDINFVDFTDDGNLDFTIFGYRDGGEGTPENPTWPDYLLVNNLAEGLTDNTAPAAPASLTATDNGSDVDLSWENGSDDTTPAEALRYNVYAQSKSNSDVVVFFPADIDNGMLKVSKSGPFISGNNITLKGMTTADYVFGVQAVDHARLSSEFTLNEYVSARSVELMDVKIYSRDHTVVIDNNRSENLKYQVLSLNGQVIYEGYSDANDTKEVQLAKGGIYLVKVSGKSAVKVEKVVVF